MLTEPVLHNTLKVMVHTLLACVPPLGEIDGVCTILITVKVALVPIAEFAHPLLYAIALTV
jgi:hypothetical protein